MFSVLLLFTACEEQEVSFLPTGEASFPSEERVEASFYGRLLDQELRPVSDAEVWIGDRMVLSDALGDWIMPAVDVVSEHAYVKIVAADCFAASRVLSVSPNSINRVRIMVARKQHYVSLQSTAGGEVELPDGSSVTFQPASFIEERTGIPYEGEVWVFASSIDGRSETSQVQMPGRL